MKKLMLLMLILVGLIFFVVSCTKEDTSPVSKPTLVLKKGGNGNGNGGNGGGNGNGNGNGNNNTTITEPIQEPGPYDDLGIRIVWTDPDHGISPWGPIVMPNFHTMQLSYEFLEPPVEGGLLNWYTIDQQVAYPDYLGVLHSSWIGGTWFPGYGNVTVVSLFYYRPNPNWVPGDNPDLQWLDPYQDNVVVYVEE